jgi:glycosyltransferase involved in cell wall biosynthesis
MRIVHAIHDFLPRHAAGSEVYAFQLCRELAQRHHVHVVAAEYDPARPHGTLAWRVHAGLPVIELVNNWEGSFGDSWRSARIGAQLDRVLRATQPDVVHVHSLLNLSFELPRLARVRGAAVVATLHDHSLVCPAGGQRLHLVERTVCGDIDPARCAACYPHSPFHAQMSVGAVSRAAGRGGRLIGRAAKWMAGRAPRAAGFASRQVAARVPPIPIADIQARLDHLRQVFDSVQLFVAPSRFVADAHEQSGLPRSKLVVSDYGFVPLAPRRPDWRPPDSMRPKVRIGFVGTLVRHKGPHVLLEAARQLPAGSFDIEIWGALDTFPDYTAHLKALAHGLPVTFCGAFRNEQAAEVFGRFDVLVVPSLWPENSPLVIHEGFMVGVPVVAARMGGIPELVRDGVNGVLYDPPSPAALAEALGGLLLAPGRLRDMAARAPAVKTIQEDARDWEQRYETLAREAGNSSAGVA